MKYANIILLTTFDNFSEQKQDEYSQLGFLYIYTSKSGKKYLCTHDAYLKLKNM